MNVFEEEAKGILDEGIKEAVVLPVTPIEGDATVETPESPAKPEGKAGNPGGTVC